jgi:hypothetical protein
VKGASLLRKVNIRVSKGFEKKLESEESKEESKEELDELKEIDNYLIGIDLIAILKNPGSSLDLVLKEGDQLIVPEKKHTVLVSGQVLVPSLVPFTENYSVKDYINSSGGFSASAHRSKLIVQYNNGEIKTVKRFLFLKFYPKLEPGAIIFVPTKPERKNKLSTQEIVGITSSIGTLGLIIQALTK